MKTSSSNMFACVAIALALLQPLSARAEVPARETLNFDSDWRFRLGDSDFTGVNVDDRVVSTGVPNGPALPEYGDASWRQLRLPHDWMIEGVPGADPAAMVGPFDPNSPGKASGGYLNGGVGWYRKHFLLPASQAGQRFTLQFDGVYMDADVYLNGTHLGNHPYGYTSFGYDLTPLLHFGAQPNVIAVRVNVHQPCSRFYSGAGIYRNVWLTRTGPVAVAPWGTYVRATGITATGAHVLITTQVDNHGAAEPVTVESTLIDPAGHEAVSATATQSIASGSETTFDQSVEVPAPALWSLEHPQLYTLRTRVVAAGQTLDETTTPFGLRTLQFTLDNGFLLNGQRVQVNGVCLHHDLGCLGAAVNYHALERQLTILHSIGCNAIRSSHYPPDPQLLDLCDRMGFLVMDEAFDEWKWAKVKFGYARFYDQWSDADVTSMVTRDRNHPSVILWSLGNEIPEQLAAEGAARATHLANLVRSLDPTRFVTAAMHMPVWAEKAGFAKPLDVFGFNYNRGYYSGTQFKGHWPLIGSETVSAYSTRGEYGLKLDAGGKVVIDKEPNSQYTGYDTDFGNWGAYSAEDSFRALHNCPWVAGEFVWTGWDYLGKPSGFGWPARGSSFGIVDSAGFLKDRSYLYQSQWTTQPMVHIVPMDWNFLGWEGKAIPVKIYTNADSVELFLNGKSLGSKSFPGATTYHLDFSVPYAPGVLKAVATKDGKVVATDEVHTAGPAAKLELVPDRAHITADGDDLAFVTVRVLDQNGNICPDAANEVTFKLSGPGSIAGLDDGDETNHEAFQGTAHKVFHGLGLAVIRSSETPGAITLSAAADGLAPVSLTIASAQP